MVIDLSEDEKAVGEGFELVRIGEETAEQVHEVPQKYIMIRTIRPKYVVRPARAAVQDEAMSSEIRVAPLPPRILPRSIATPSLLASVLTGKFCDGLPFYRQERIFARHGLTISRQDIANWTIAIVTRLESVLTLMQAELLSSSYLYCDETFFQVMDEPGRANSTQSYMWGTTGGVLYQYSRTRSSSFIITFLSSYAGFLQTDGYDGYNTIGEKEGIVHVDCWAHARRKFVEELKLSGGESSAAQIIAMISILYEHETKLRGLHFGKGIANGCHSLHGGTPHCRHASLQSNRGMAPRKGCRSPTPIGAWQGYLVHLGPMAEAHLLYRLPNLTPDSNEAERAIRPFTIGRKNWVIPGGPRGAFASAALYSVIETAKTCALEPYYYLRYILTKLPTTDSSDLPSLLPWNADPKDFGELTAEDARISLDSIPID